ncbi:MAG: hypothetical protein M1826_007291 [Phylliscum demangeonii]|nr:MAG: hypothetical protein M1826_007291 [Phylliscum demangeonii]
MPVVARLHEAHDISAAIDAMQLVDTRLWTKTEQPKPGHGQEGTRGRVQEQVSRLFTLPPPKGTSTKSDAVAALEAPVFLVIGIQTAARRGRTINDGHSSLPADAGSGVNRIPTISFNAGRASVGHQKAPTAACLLSPSEKAQEVEKLGDDELDTVLTPKAG